MFEAAKEAVWICQLLRAIGFPQNEPTTIYCDNNAARILSEDPLLHARVKHMDIKYHYLQECVENREVVLKYISTGDNLADALTKPLER